MGSPELVNFLGNSPFSLLFEDMYINILYFMALLKFKETISSNLYGILTPTNTLTTSANGIESHLQQPASKNYSVEPQTISLACDHITTLATSPFSATSTCKTTASMEKSHNNWVICSRYCSSLTNKGVSYQPNKLLWTEALKCVKQ